MTEIKKEKAESKKGYSYDLHEAIRDVRRSFVLGGVEEQDKRIRALFDLCVPEVREAVLEELKPLQRNLKEQYSVVDNFYVVEGWGGIRNFEEVKRNSEKVNFRRKHGGRFHEENGWWVDGRKFDLSNATGINHVETKRNRDVVKAKIYGKYNHSRFQVVVNVLDRHGELRKWREVAYGGDY